MEQLIADAKQEVQNEYKEVRCLVHTWLLNDLASIVINYAFAGQLHDLEKLLLTYSVMAACAFSLEDYFRFYRLLSQACATHPRMYQIAQYCLINKCQRDSCYEADSCTCGDPCSTVDLLLLCLARIK